MDINSHNMYTFTETYVNVALLFRIVENVSFSYFSKHLNKWCLNQSWLYTTEVGSCPQARLVQYAAVNTVGFTIIKTYLFINLCNLDCKGLFFCIADLGVNWKNSWSYQGKLCRYIVWTLASSSLLLFFLADALLASSLLEWYDKLTPFSAAMCFRQTTLSSLYTEIIANLMHCGTSKSVDFVLLVHLLWPGTLTTHHVPLSWRLYIILWGEVPCSTTQPSA